MTVGPFPVSVVIERLKEKATELLEVAGAAELNAALEQNPASAVAAYVTSAEVGEKPKYTSGTHLQDVAVTVRIVLFVRNYAGQASGAGAREQMDLEVIPAVRKALLGWTPSDAFEGLTFQAGRDERFSAGWLVTQQVFTTKYRMQQESSS